jgi:hypothetical protein
MGDTFLEDGGNSHEEESSALEECKPRDRTGPVHQELGARERKLLGTLPGFRYQP